MKPPVRSPTFISRGVTYHVMTPEITSIESTEFAYPIEDVGTDQHGFDLVYEQGL
jgi:hypothetical protein